MKLERSVLKAQYTRFCEAWSNEKRYQQYLADKGEPIPAGHNKLGRKPTFAMWLQAVKNKRLATDITQQPPDVAEKQLAEKQIEVADTEW